MTIEEINQIYRAKIDYIILELRDNIDRHLKNVKDGVSILSQEYIDKTDRQIEALEIIRRIFL